MADPKYVDAFLGGQTAEQYRNELSRMADKVGRLTIPMEVKYVLAEINATVYGLAKEGEYGSDEFGVHGPPGEWSRNGEAVAAEVERTLRACGFPSCRVSMSSK